MSSAPRTPLRVRAATAGALLLILGGAVALRLWLCSATLGDDDLRQAYAAWFLVAPDSEKHAVVNWPDDVPYRRMGVNLPLAATMRLFGVHDWAMSLAPLSFSVLGMVATFFLVRRIVRGGAAQSCSHPAGAPIANGSAEPIAAAGRGAGRCHAPSRDATRAVTANLAGLAGAAMYAVLPEDVYGSTLWLQDAIFTGTFAVFVLCWVMAADALGRGRFLLGIAAGGALGYAQYVKDSAFLSLVPVAAWAAWQLVQRRRGGLGVALSIVAGFALMQIAMVGVFWPRHPEIAYYWRETIAMIRMKTAEPHPASMIMPLLWRRFMKSWLFGYAVGVFPLTLLAALADRRNPHRMLLLLVLGSQAVVLFFAMRMTLYQNRYVMQLAVPFIAISVVGAVSLAQRIAPADRWTLRSSRTTRVAGRITPNAVTVAALLLLIGATGAAIDQNQQQYGADRTSALRAAHQFLSEHADPAEPIFAALNATYAYTARTLYQFDEFRPRAGGIHDLALASAVDHGWIVLGNLEYKWLGRKPPDKLESGPLAFSAGDRKYWARVFRIESRAGPVDVPARLLDFPGNGSRLETQLKVTAGAAHVERRGNEFVVTGSAGDKALVYFERPECWNAEVPGVLLPLKAQRAIVTVAVRAGSRVRACAGTCMQGLDMEGGALPREHSYGKTLELSAGMQNAEVSILQHVVPVESHDAVYVEPLLRVEFKSAGEVQIEGISIDAE